MRANIEDVSDPYKRYTPVVRKAKITRLILMPICGRFTAECLWRSLKQEEVYRRAYETVAEAGKGIADYLRYFNEERPH